MHALLPGAATAAVDARTLSGCWADHDGDDGTPDVLLEVDQRGHGRMADGNHDGIVRCDIGAVERLPEPSALAGSLVALAGTAWLSARRRR